MPRGQPFTALCQLAARLTRPVAADLHAHTTASDGDYTPSQLVAHARQSRLAAIAVTDHDTIDGVAAAQAAARSLGSLSPEVIPGIELSAEFEGQEVHLLGLFINTDDAALLEESELMLACRRQRFRGYMAAIAEMGQAIEPGLIAAVETTSASLGRRHVAGLLMRTGIAHSWSEAWRRFVGPLTQQVPPKRLVPLRRGVELIRGAGGIAALAHPTEATDEAALTRFADAGLQAVEVRFPAASVSRTANLTTIARRLGLHVCGGSDCHGGNEPKRGVGTRGISAEELDALRGLVA